MRIFTPLLLAGTLIVIIVLAFAPIPLKGFDGSFLETNRIHIFPSGELRVADYQLGVQQPAICQGIDRDSDTFRAFTRRAYPVGTQISTAAQREGWTMTAASSNPKISVTSLSGSDHVGYESKVRLRQIFGLFRPAQLIVDSYKDFKINCSEPGESGVITVSRAGYPNATTNVQCLKQLVVDKPKNEADLLNLTVGETVRFELYVNPPGQVVVARNIYTDDGTIVINDEATPNGNTANFVAQCRRSSPGTYTIEFFVKNDTNREWQRPLCPFACNGAFISEGEEGGSMDNDETVENPEPDGND